MKSDTGLDRQRFLATIADLGSHTVYYPEKILARLQGCGLDVSLLPDGGGLRVQGLDAPCIEPEWGEPGVMAIQILSIVFRNETGEWPSSIFVGRGFVFKDVLNQMAAHWGLQPLGDDAISR